MGIEVGLAGHHETRRAEAALLGIVIHKRRGNRVELSLGRQAFDCADVRAGFSVMIGNVNGQHAAGIDRFPVYDDCACSAGPAVANFLCGGEIEMVAQSIQQRDARFDREFFRFAVNAEGHRYRTRTDHFARANHLGHRGRGGCQLVACKSLRGRGDARPPD